MIELFAASALFLIWMYWVKPYEIWQYDFINVLIFTIIGAFLNTIANAIRTTVSIFTGKPDAKDRVMR